MNPEELEAILGNAPALDAFDTSSIFGQLATGLEPVADFDTIGEREMLYHAASSAANNYIDIIPDTYRNFSDPTGFVVTQYSEQSDITVSETRVFGRLIRSVETETYNRDESLTVGNDTPLQTVFSHSVRDVSAENTFPLTPTVNNTNGSFAESYSVENAALSLDLTHSDSSRTLAGNPLLDTHSTKLELGLADMDGASIAFSDVSVQGERLLELVTVEYPGLEGEQSTLALPVSTNILVPLALGAAEGFASNPDPVALIDTVGALAQLPEPIGSLTGGAGALEGLPSLDMLG